MHNSIFVLGFAVLVMLVSWASFRLAPETSPVARGALIANANACFGCHGALASPVIEPNSCPEDSNRPSHPEYSLNCADLLAFFEVVRLRNSLNARSHNADSNKLMAGELLARKYNCFQCHGYLGQGGFKNAGALKGYIPGYFGSDFRHLTNNADPTSVRQWITHGLDQSLIESPVTGALAKYFLQRQSVSMPSFASLEPDDIELLVQYVIALNNYGPMTALDLRSYADQTSR